MVRVADRVGVGERVVERDVRAVQVAHGPVRALGRDPVVHLAAVPGLVLRRPAVVERAVALGERLAAGSPPPGAGVAELPRVLPARAVGLVEDAVAAGQLDRGAVAEAAHPLQRAEVVVEGAVFLHQDHDVLHVGDGAGARGLRARGAQRRDAERRAGAYGRGGANEGATGYRRHAEQPAARSDTCPDKIRVMAVKRQ